MRQVENTRGERKVDRHFGTGSKEPDITVAPAQDDDPCCTANRRTFPMCRDRYYGVTGSQTGASTEIPYFREITGFAPYAWQRRLYKALVGGSIPDAVDIPTGLGKTICILVHLLARLENEALPTRVVYVVDRRTIVDQTAETIRVWIDQIGQLPRLAQAFRRISAFSLDHPIGLGVLRGGFADDGQWRIDPARPTVVVGTVDMIGSRIMFSGYGDGRSRRPMHAGLLGHDSVAMLDEAHLSTAMAALIRSVKTIQGHPRFHAMTLSATSADNHDRFGLLPEDESDARVHRRLHAMKLPRFVEVGTPRERIRTICKVAAAYSTGSIAIFVRTVRDADKISRALSGMLGDQAGERVALLVGRLRGKERRELVRHAVWKRFLPDRSRCSGTPSVYLVMTSAGEVGVDLDADHAVMDLSTLDSLTQRVGRVNRSGLVKAEITIVFLKQEAAIAGAAPTTPSKKYSVARAKTLQALNGLPNLSPSSLCKLGRQTLEACSEPRCKPAILHPEVVEAFAATSATLQLPPVSVYLRGVSDRIEPPECFLVWRWEVPELVRLGSRAAESALLFYRPQPDEIARLPAYEARAIIVATIRRHGNALPVIVGNARGEVRAIYVEDEADLPSLDYATVILPTTAGGLEPTGLPSPTAKNEVFDAADNAGRLRYVRHPCGQHDAENGQVLPDWLNRGVELRIPLHEDDDIEPGHLIYVLRQSDPALQTGESELSFFGASTQTLDQHASLVADAALQIGQALAHAHALADKEVCALQTAGRWHDHGKSRRAWQLAAGASLRGPILAKSRRGQFRPGFLGGYRHEFGSLVEAERAIPLEYPARDLALHLIAAHHGWARPAFPNPRQWDPDTPTEVNRRLAIAVSDRYARLQTRYGPWRLAWLESLLKAADTYASNFVKNEVRKPHEMVYRSAESG